MDYLTEKEYDEEYWLNSKRDINECNKKLNGHKFNLIPDEKCFYECIVCGYIVFRKLYDNKYQPCLTSLVQDGISNIQRTDMTCEEILMETVLK